MSVLLTVAVLALLALWALAVYNRLVGLRRLVTRAWTHVDVQLKRRHALIPDLVNAANQAVEFDSRIVADLLAERDAAVAATGIADAGRKEGALTRTVDRFVEIAEGQSLSAAADALRSDLADIAGKIASTQQVYNGVAAKYNTAIQVFPGNLVAGFAGFNAAELFVTTGATEQAG
jgi:LemA protein